MHVIWIASWLDEAAADRGMDMMSSSNDATIWQPWELSSSPSSASSCATYVFADTATDSSSTTESNPKLVGSIIISSVQV